MRLTIVSFALFALVASCAASRDPTGEGTGGDDGEGGTTDTGSSTDTDITTDTGGVVGSGGKSGSGGKAGTGGVKGTGGAPGTGGAKGTGGVKGTGGSSLTTGNCTDATSFTSLVTGAYGGTPVPVGTPGKSYYMIANWWGVQTSASESISGLGFTVNGVGSASSANSKPMGFPSLFIGNYGGRATTGSNLPKQVSALTSVPTTFITNVDAKGISQYNATYDVWFTRGNGVATNDPGPGGAFLMVWQFKPSDRYPRGQVKVDGHIVKGVPGAWSIWYDNTDPPCVSYVSAAKQNAFNFDLVYFIKDAIAGGYGVTNNQYLSIIFAGFEIWAGGDGLQVKQFCANVQ